MVRVVAKKSFKNRLKNFAKSRYFFPFLLFVFLVIAVPVTVKLLNKPQDVRQRAAGTPTAVISFSPSSETVQVNQPFTVSLVIDGGGQAFNAASANVTLSPNLTVQGITEPPVDNGGCNFTYVNNGKTPTTSDPSFAGGILTTSSLHCTLYVLTLVPTAVGTETITLSNGSVKAFTDSSEIFSSFVNGSYEVVLALPSPTPTPTTPPPPSVTFDSFPPETYKTSLVLSGGKDASITFVFVNDSVFGVTYPTSNTWQLPVTLNIGSNSFAIYGKTLNGDVTSTSSAIINRHKEADIDGSGVVDLTDLSLFGADYGSLLLNSPLSDINGDGLVDLTDFSIFARDYGQ